MTAAIILFPRRAKAGPSVRVIHDNDGWLMVIDGAGWSFGSRREALIEADRAARELGRIIVVEHAP